MQIRAAVDGGKSISLTRSSTEASAPRGDTRAAVSVCRCACALVCVSQFLLLRARRGRGLHWFPAGQSGALEETLVETLSCPETFGHLIGTIMSLFEPHTLVRWGGNYSHGASGLAGSVRRPALGGKRLHLNTEGNQLFLAGCCSRGFL